MVKGPLPGRIAGDTTGEVIWLRIGDVIGQLANTTPSGPLH
jgi:hypothetical protein